MERTKRLYRNRYDKVIAGVAGGLARYFNIDPVIARIIFVALVLASGGGVLIYIILWIAVPIDPDFSSYSTDYRKDYKSPETNDSGAKPAEEPTSETGAARDEYDQTDRPYAAYEKKQTNGNLLAGIVLIVIGGLLLAVRFIPQIGFRNLWPLLLIAGGILVLMNSFSKPKNNNQ